MKITQSKTNDLIAVLTVDIKGEDYIEKVDKSLKKYRKEAQIPGFRKGKIPMEIINKKYRKSVVVEEVNKLLQNELYKYINSEKLKVLGSPIPIDNKSIDWEANKDFNFKYEIGLAPEFDLNINSKDKLSYYKIKADKKIVNNYCIDIAKKYGKMSNPELSIDGDLVYCSIEQLDENAKIMKNGIRNDATVAMHYISDPKTKKKFIGLKKGDMLTINVVNTFTNHSDLAAMLNVKQADIHNLTSKEFLFTVKNINRLEPAELNLELFDKVYGVGIVKNEKEFKDKVKTEAEAQFEVESDRMLKNDIVTYLINKLNLKLPNEFLKKWLIQTSEQPITMELLEKEYDMYAKSLQWQLIENKVLEKYKINVSQEDVLSHAKDLIKIQMRQYGQPEGDDKQLSDIAKNILKNKDERKKLHHKLIDERTMSVYKQNFKLNEKSISYDDFIKLASEK